MQSIVIESKIELKTAVLKLKKDWIEDRQSKRMKRIDVPISDKIKPSYHVRTYIGSAGGRSSQMKQFTLVFTEEHFKNKEISEKDANGVINTVPFTFIEGMEILFKNKSFVEVFDSHKAYLKVAPSNKETISWLIDEALIKPEWIGNQQEFLKMIQGTKDNEFVRALKDSTRITPVAPSGDLASGVAGSKILAQAQTEMALKAQEAEVDKKVETLQIKENESKLKQEPVKAKKLRT